MKWEEYIKESARTDTDRGDEAWDYYTTGLFEEVGEVLGIIKKAKWHGHELNRVALELEFGDVAWHVAALCRLLRIEVSLTPAAVRSMLDWAKLLAQEAGRMPPRYSLYHPAWLDRVFGALVYLSSEYGFDFEDVLQANIDKLRARYPDGFSEEASQRREA